MTIQVYDEDVGADDIIGEVTFKLSALCIGNGMDEWFAIAYRGKAAGQVHLKSVWKAGAGGAAKQKGPAQPGMMQPGMMQPGMMQPGMMQPGMMQPGMMQPGM
jgi:hypothetical protein